MVRPTLPALLCGLVLIAGCGGDSEENNAYVDDVNAAQVEFADNVARLSREITEDSSPREDRATLDRFEGAIDGVVDDLRRIDPPDVVDAEHDRLVAAMNGFGTEVEEATDALRDPTRSRIERAQRTLAQATAAVDRRINAAITAINSKLGAA